MKYFVAASLVASSLAAYVPSEPWSTLTPSAPAPSGATTDHTHSFGIEILTISGSSSAAAPTTTSKAKRDAVNQIGDGQIQKQTSVTLSTKTKPTSATVINQIGDGQIQHQTTAAPVSVVNQIGDGQIQHQTTAAPVSVVNQIGDGQIQHQTTAAPVSVVNQIGDGQIQHQTTKTASVANQIGDGQIQHQTTKTASGAASQITDGQVQATASSDADAGDSSAGLACKTENSLAMVLKGGELTDSKGRIGAIVANRQFQFDGPPPQAGTIYAGGWSVTSDGYLAIGDNDVFYQCLSGDFYNLYDENVAAQCSAVNLRIIDLVSC